MRHCLLTCVAGQIGGYKKKLPLLPVVLAAVLVVCFGCHWLADQTGHKCDMEGIAALRH
jgi:hypothetical protein